MLRTKLFWICPCAALLLLAVSAGNVSAAIVASFAGPKTFNGTSDYEPLPNLSIGLEGRIDLEFKTNDTNSGTIWYMVNPAGPWNEYRLAFDNGFIKPFIYSGNYLFPTPALAVPFSDTTNWHTLSYGWRSSDGAVDITLDGVPTTSQFGVNQLPAFTSTSNVLGAVIPGSFLWFNGEMRNVLISDSYAPIPEPSSLVLAAGFGLVGFASYRRWKRRK